jgi:hypothetical protein
MDVPASNKKKACSGAGEFPLRNWREHTEMMSPDGFQRESASAPRYRRSGPTTIEWLAMPSNGAPGGSTRRCRMATGSARAGRRASHAGASAEGRCDRQRRAVIPAAATIRTRGRRNPIRPVGRNERLIAADRHAARKPSDMLMTLVPLSVHHWTAAIVTAAVAPPPAPLKIFAVISVTSGATEAPPTPLVLIVPATCDPCPFVSVCAELLARRFVEMIVLPMNA